MIKNAYYMLITLLMKFVSSSVILLLLAKQWGVEGFGFFMYPFTIATLLVLIIDYGFTLKVMKEVSETPENVSNIITLSLYSKLILSFFTFFIFMLFAIYNFTSSDQIFLGVILLISNAINSFAMFLNLPLRCFGKFKIETKISFLSNFIYILILIVLIYLNSDQIIIALGILAARIFYVIFSIYFYKKEVSSNRILVQVETKLIKSTLINNFPYAIHIIIGSLYFQVDTLLVHYFYGDQGVGLYQASMRIISAALVFSEVINNIYMPKLANSKKGFKDLLKYYEQMTTYSHLLGAFISVLLFVFSRLIIDLIYGEQYQSVIPILRGLSLLLFIRFSGAASGTLLTVVDKQKLRALAAVLALIVNFISNLILLPMYGIFGAVISGIITALLLNLFYYINCYFLFRKVPINQKAMSIIIFWVVTIVLTQFYIV